MENARVGAALLPSPGAGRKDSGAPFPMVYVVLVSFRNWRDTVECLGTVLRQAYPRFQVIVCDNRSPDDSVDRIRAWCAGEQAPPEVEASLGALSSPPVPKPLRLVEYTAEEAATGGSADDAAADVVLLHASGNHGFGAGNNVALRYVLARGDAAYAWILNNDTVVAPDALAELVSAAESDAALGMVGSKLLYYDHPEVIQAAGGGRLVRWTGMTHLYGQGEPDDGRWAEPFEPEYVHGASLLVRMEVCRDVGVFDERYFIYSEEVDWAIRARREGWRLGYAPRSQVWHKESATFGFRSPFHDYHAVRSALELARKLHPRVLPVLLPYTVYRCLLPKIVRRQPERLKAVASAYRDFFARKAPAP